MRRVNSALLICNFKYVFNMYLFLWLNDNSGAQMFQMADQSKEEIREVPMISKQLPAALNSAKILFILFQSMPKKFSL